MGPSVRGRLGVLGHGTDGSRAGAKPRVVGRSLGRAETASQVSPSAHNCEVPPACPGTRETELKRSRTGEPDS